MPSLGYSKDHVPGVMSNRNINDMPPPPEDRIKIRKCDNFYSNRQPNGKKDYAKFDARTFGHVSNF